jgi:aldose 1-epimerase
MTDVPEGRATLTSPSGRQLVVSAGNLRAVAVEVGGGLRELTIGGEPVVWGYPPSAIASGGRGQILVPWPNRVEDGTYRFGDAAGSAALDEPEHHNAIHGLVRWLLWRVREHTSTRVALGCELAPQPAYPWRLLLEVTYEVGEDGLVVETTAENRSETPAPFGFGAHPYLAAGERGIDSCMLEVPASRRLLLDERGLPTGSEPVEGSPFDFRTARALDGMRLDDCFTDLRPPHEHLPQGAAWQVTLTRPDGGRWRLWADSGLPYVMIYTGDTLAPADRRRAVAVEPMTCPPNALRSGESLVTLAPGERWSGRFGIRCER